MTLLCVYPDGQVTPRWLWIICALGALFTILWSLFPTLFIDPTAPLGIVGPASAIILSCLSLYGQVWRYQHHASFIQRQQTKWFVFALGIFFVLTIFSLIPPFLIAPSGGVSDGLSIWGDLGDAALVLGNIVIPIAVGIAILRYRLWDIDIIIRRTLTYAILSAFLVLIYFGIIVLLQRVLSLLTSATQNEIVTVISTLAIAAVFIPLRNRIQQVIDRRFYRKKYDAQKVLSDFAATVRDETDLENLTGKLVQVVSDTMQPRTVSVWLREGARADETLHA